MGSCAVSFFLSPGQASATASKGSTARRLTAMFMTFMSSRGVLCGLVYKRSSRESIEVFDELLHAVQVACNHVADFSWRDRLFSSHMANHSLEWRNVEARISGHSLSHRGVVRG